MTGRARTNLKTGAPTRTRTQTKKRASGVTKNGENSSISSHRFGYNMSARLKALYRNILGRNTNRVVTGFRHKTEQGQQNQFVDSVLTQSDLAAIKTAIVGSGTDAANDYKFFLGYMKYKTIMKNQSNHVQRVSIYDLVIKHNPPSSTIDTPLEVWQKGLTDFGMGATERLVPGNTPFVSPEFRRFFDVVKVTNVYLEPGQQHEHTVYRKINRLVKSTEFDVSNGISFKGLTYFSMINCLGSIGHDNTNTSLVSYMPCLLDIVTHKEFNYGYLAGSKPSFASTNNLSSVTNFDFMGESGDVDIDPADS